MHNATPQQDRRWAAQRGIVVTHSLHPAISGDGHETSTRREIARRLAAFMDFADEGEYDPSSRYTGPLYFVPSDAVTTAMASRLGIRAEHDLFGGVVPHAFVATKTITHSLLDAGSAAPSGWCAEFPCRVADVVLEGFSAFSGEDAAEAGRALLQRGPVRVKRASGIAGKGQFVVDSETTLARQLGAIDPEEMSHSGVVVEQNLTEVVTHSVGQVRVSDAVGSYYGTQHLTTNNHGVEVYGGSEIVVVQGGFDALLALALPGDVRLAIVQARVYDDAATRCFDGFYASRRNYDVAQGRDAGGARRSGVLEQSWRAGGASGAEIGALEAFRANPSLRAVRAATREVYGETPALPPGAAVYFSGIDPRVGPMTKYAWTEPYADPR
jgi:hypothetical protein